MPAHLQPALQTLVKMQQDAAAALVDDERGSGDMPDLALAAEEIRLLLQKAFYQFDIARFFFIFGIVSVKNCGDPSAFIRAHAAFHLPGRRPLRRTSESRSAP